MGEWAPTVGEILLPLTYSGDAISQIILYGHNLGDILSNLGVLMDFLDHSNNSQYCWIASLS